MVVLAKANKLKKKPTVNTGLKVSELLVRELNELRTKELALCVLIPNSVTGIFHLLKSLDFSHLKLIYKQWSLHTFAAEGINNSRTYNRSFQIWPCCLPKLASSASPKKLVLDTRFRDG